MKKLLIVMILLTALITGCGNETEEPKNIHEIEFTNKIIFHTDGENKSTYYCTDQFFLIQYGEFERCGVSTNVEYPYGVTTWELCNYIWDEYNKGSMCSQILFNETIVFDYQDGLNQTIAKIIILAQQDDTTNWTDIKIVNIQTEEIDHIR